MGSRGAKVVWSPYSNQLLYNKAIDLAAKGEAFDRAYIAHEVDMHQNLLNALDQTLIPNAQNAELKTLLQGGRAKVQAHLARQHHRVAVAEVGLEMPDEPMLPAEHLGRHVGEVALAPRAGEDDDADLHAGHRDRDRADVDRRSVAIADQRQIVRVTGGGAQGALDPRGQDPRPTLSVAGSPLRRRPDAGH